MRKRLAIKTTVCTGAVAAFTLCSVSTFAGDSIGPDVTAWSIGNGINEYGVQADGKASYAIETISCNHGDEVVQWVSSTPDHPVIAQAMYRLKDGRFEQLGMSWLKHGFFALSQFLCGNCQSTGGSTLGIDCADTYSASLNASGLGPRSDVDAATGASTAGPSFSASGPHFGRIAVEADDVDPALNGGALYFIEGHYVAEDDTAAGNDNNNASYRQVGINSITNVQAIGDTVEGNPAIFAWRANNPAVTLNFVDVASDGRFIVGVDVTDNGDGTWHYEYAIQNLTSSRNGGSFSVPVPDGTNVTNVGFHAPEYHSGEIWSNDPWTWEVADGELTWQTTPYKEDPQASALRWGTTYNFWFDIDAAPVVGNAMIGLFTPGSPSVAAVINTKVPELPRPCPADFDGGGDVGIADLLELLGNWGTDGIGADLAEPNDVVDVADLLVLLGDWGPC